MSEGNKQPRKTRDVWRLYVNYGQGWEHEITEDTYAGYIENKRLYRENCTYPQRWVQGRERIQEVET